MSSTQRAEALFDFEPTAEVELKMQVRAKRHAGQGRSNCAVPVVTVRHIHPLAARRSMLLCTGKGLAGSSER